MCRNGMRTSESVHWPIRDQARAISHGGLMSFERQLAFWLATFVVVIVLLWLLSDILLPFVAGMVIAYLLDPLTNRLERLGVNRRFAAFLIVGVFVLVVV